MTKDEALKLALEALENSVDLVREDAYNAEKLYGNYPSRQGKVAGLKVLADDHEKAITAIKQALEAPPTHKTARWTDEEYREISDQVISTLVEYGAELRTADCQMQILREELAESRREAAQLKAQRQWVGLTDEERNKLWRDVVKWGDPSHDDVDLIKAIEAKLKEKNT
jgi:hypothetical protein